eukprot:m.356046 g.356046  ORF g.356046 m.356046 type:complete len:122 (+) comp20744_c0_seq2:2162-2527(+)
MSASNSGDYRAQMMCQRSIKSIAYSSDGRKFTGSWPIVHRYYSCKFPNDSSIVIVQLSLHFFILLLVDDALRCTAVDTRSIVSNRRRCSARMPSQSRMTARTVLASPSSVIVRTEVWLRVA